MTTPLENATEAADSAFRLSGPMSSQGYHHHTNNDRTARRLNPFPFYRRVLKRFFLLYRHFSGLLVGGLVAYVHDLPSYKRKFFRSAGSRVLALLLTPLIDKNIRTQPFEIQLRMRLEMLGPTYIKLGQILAIREDILPQNITDELKRLLDKLPEVSFPLIKEIIENSLGQPLNDIFSEIDPVPIGSASIGQTHLATTGDGLRVVVKVIKPGIRETMLSDIRLLQILATILEWLIPHYQPKVIIREFCAYTEKEIDLTFEADHAEIFAANFAEHPDILFPKIYRDLSTADVLCMEFFDGIKPNDRRVFSLEQEQQQRIIDLGASAIIKMLYEDGFFHADLHAGNLIVLPGPKVGFIDLGMVGRFEEKTKLNMLYYFHSLVNGDIENSAKYLLAMAQVGPSGDTDGFRRSVSDLFRRYRLQASHGGFSLGELILESLTIGGRFRIFFPVEMTLMVKALVTFEGVGLLLDPKLDVPELSRKHIERVFANHYNPQKLVGQIMRGIPEFIDVLVRLPELVSEGARFLEKTISEPPQKDPFPGLRSAVIAGSCIVAGVLAIVQGASPVLWIGLFVMAGLLSLFGK